MPRPSIVKYDAMKGKFKDASRFLVTSFRVLFIRGGRIRKARSRLFSRFQGYLGRKVAARYQDDMKALQDALKRCQDPVILEVNAVLSDVVERTDAAWQKDIMDTYGTLLMGFWYRDTAYRHQADYALLEVLRKADILIPILEGRVKESRRWYVNIAERGRKETEELHAKGRLSRHQVADRLAPFSNAWDRHEARNRKQ